MSDASWPPQRVRLTPGKRVLFLVPSLALLSQSLTEWTQESSVPLHSFAVCSDADRDNPHVAACDEYVPIG